MDKFIEIQVLSNNEFLNSQNQSKKILFDHALINIDDISNVVPYQFEFDKDSFCVNKICNYCIHFKSGGKDLYITKEGYDIIKKLFFENIEESL